MKSSRCSEKTGQEKSKNMTQGRRRSARLQSNSKLNEFPLQSPDPLKPCREVSSSTATPARFKYLDKKHNGFSISAKRFKKVEKTSPDVYEDSQGRSSGSQYRSLINDFSEPFPPRPLSSIPKVCERQHVTHNVPNQRIEQAFVTAENEGSRNCQRNDPFEDTRVYATVSSFAGTPTNKVMISNVSTQSAHFGLTNIVNSYADEDLGADEAESSLFLLILGKYVVKEALAPTVRSIIEKHGDIAAYCHMETQEGRSFTLENLAEFIQKFEKKRFAELSQSEIEEALKVVSDFGKVGLDVGWLQQRLKELLEARQMIKQYVGLKGRLRKKEEGLKEKKRSLKIAESQLVLLQQQVNAANKELDVEVAEVESIKTTITDAVAKVTYFNDHPPLDGLF